MWNGLAIESEEQLEDLLSAPTAGVVDTLGRLDGDILLLGAGVSFGIRYSRSNAPQTNTITSAQAVMPSRTEPSEP